MDLDGFGWIYMDWMDNPTLQSMITVLDQQVSLPLSLSEQYLAWLVGADSLWFWMNLDGFGLIWMDLDELD